MLLFGHPANAALVSRLGGQAYYDTLGAGPQSGWGAWNTGPCSNFHPDRYWSGTGYAPGPTNAWFFSFGFGVQSAISKGQNYYAWAVHPGDIAPIPVPGAVWLLGSALGVLGLVRRTVLTGTG